MARTMPRCTRLAIAAGPPPTIVVEYERCCSNSPISGITNKSDERMRTDHRRKTIRLHNLATSSDSAETVARRLGRKFPRHLGAKVVKHTQLRGLIFKLQCLVKAGSATPRTKESETISCFPEKDAVEEQDDGGDLNLASENELAAAKMRMNVTFEQNLMKPGSPGYVHDVRKDFDQPGEECDWDDDDDDDDDDEDSS